MSNATPEAAMSGWIARHDLTTAQCQAAFNDYVHNQGMQLVDISGYGSTQPLYAALWVKTASTLAWEARDGLTSADYQTLFNQLTAQGYFLVLVNGYATAAGPRFACIFQQGTTGAWITHDIMTSEQYQAAFDQYVNQGYVLDWVSGYFDGTQDLYAAIWSKRPGAPAWQARHGLTSDEYQAFFNTVTAQGYKPTVVCGYTDGTQPRYAAIFRQIANAPSWQARHGLTSAQYQATFDQLGSQGYRLELVNGYSVNNQDFFAALWTK